MSKPMAQSYFRVGDRPVKFFSAPDGRCDVFAMNWETGEFVRDLRYLAECFRPWGDAEPLTEQEFNRYVQTLRMWIRGSKD